LAISCPGSLYFLLFLFLIIIIPTQQHTQTLLTSFDLADKALAVGSTPNQAQ
jgi:hypothetical protein